MTPAGSTTLNGLCPYYTMFPLSFPMRRLRSGKAGEWVLDPFCGRGTTNFAARLLGLPSIGIDSNPVAVAIAQAKVVATSPERIVRACREILASAREPCGVPEGAFWRTCFHRDTLNEVCVVREALLRDCRSAARKALRGLLLGRLHGPRTKGAPSYLSNQMPRTFAPKPKYAVGFWRRRKLTPPRVNVLDLVGRMSHWYFREVPRHVPAHIIYGDSGSVDLAHLGPRASWVVTSPPYYGMRTYVPDQWLRNWFLGGPPHVPYSAEGQIVQSSQDDFAEALAKVWANVAGACRPGARLSVRFGAIHDRRCDPRDLIRASFRRCDEPWSVRAVRSAGRASHGKRQAGQFGRVLRSPVEEWDVLATLAG